MSAWAAAMAAIVRRDAILFASYRGQLVTKLLGVVFNVTLFYYLSRLLGGDTFGGPADYFAYVVVGLVIMQVLTTALGLAPVTVRQELIAGTLERLLVSPFGVVSGIVAMMVFPLIEALVSGALVLLVATIAFGFPLAASVGLAIPVAILGALAFLPFSLLLAAVVLRFKQAASGTQFVIAAVAIAGGLYFPVSLLPDWIEWTSHVQPFTPAADLLRHVISGQDTASSALLDLARLAGFAAVLLPIAVLVLDRAIRSGRRRGSIIEF